MTARPSAAYDVGIGAGSFVQISATIVGRLRRAGFLIIALGPVRGGV
jgi:hypothetical protein